MNKRFKSTDPHTGEDGLEYDEPSYEQLVAVVDRATEASDSPALADPRRRAAALRSTAGRLRDDATAIVATAQFETGLPSGRLLGELERTAVQLELLAAVCAAGDYVEAIIDRADPAARPGPRPDIRRMLVPRGPTVVFGASNFPLAFGAAGGDTGSALAAGCPVVVKGHPSHPGTGQLVAEHVQAAVAEAQLPPGTFAHVPSGDHEVGRVLVEHPAVRAVAFTGSLRGGRALMDRAAARATPIPVYAEMGSLNPLVVAPGALADPTQLAIDLAASICTFGGQLCTKPGLVFVPAGPDGDRFVDAVAAEIERHGPQVMLNRATRDAYVAGISDLRASQGVDLLTRTETPTGPGFLAAPALAQTTAATLARAHALREEHFGPAAIIVRYDSPTELADALALLEGQLTATLHADPTADQPAIAALWSQLGTIAGRVIFGGLPTGVSVTWAMQHGGPYPASSTSGETSVGPTSIRRFLRPVAFQSTPASLLPPALRDDNPLGLWRRVNGRPTPPA